MFLLLLKPTKPLSGDMSKPNAVLLFELGNLQVYHFPTPEEITRGTLPTEVYWQDKASRHTYGPFPSIHATMSHYTYTIATQKIDANGAVGNVIYADFVKKKRMTIGG